MFDVKLEELKDNIEPSYAYPAPQAYGQTRHYAMGDGDYPDPLPGQRPLFDGYPTAADCKTDRPKTLEQQQYEEDMAFYNQR